jgi:acyl-ACP dehydrogenase
VTDSASLGIDEYRALLDEVFDQQIVEWTAEAEASERFPCKLIEHLGQSGVFAHKWGDGQRLADRRDRSTFRAGRVRGSRSGGGTDEVLWELVAPAMKPDYDGYAELIGRGNA